MERDLICDINSTNSCNSWLITSLSFSSIISSAKATRASFKAVGTSVVANSVGKLEPAISICNEVDALVPKRDKAAEIWGEGADKSWVTSSIIAWVTVSESLIATELEPRLDLINSIVDSAYIQLRDRFQSDSAFVTNIVDTSYIQSKQLK